jgi:hypothetical protein
VQLICWDEVLLTTPQPQVSLKLQLSRCPPPKQLGTEAWTSNFLTWQQLLSQRKYWWWQWQWEGMCACM